MGAHEPPASVYGVDFSAGRARAGEETWIAEAVVGNGLRVVEVARAVERLDVVRHRKSLLPALARFLGRLGEGTAIGLDFPFGLPREVIAADGWPEFLRQFPGWADDPADMARETETRASLHSTPAGAVGDGSQNPADLRSDGAAAGLLRATEEPLGAVPAYDERLRTETFYGIRDLLRPLVLADVVRAVPMQEPDSGCPVLLEVYPTGTLERLDAHDLRYVGDDENARQRRAANLHVLETTGVTIDDCVRERALADDDGDALDAVVAAVATYQHTRNPCDLHTDDDVRTLEGHIYV